MRSLALKAPRRAPHLPHVALPCRVYMLTAHWGLAPLNKTRGAQWAFGVFIYFIYPLNKQTRMIDSGD